MKRKNVTCIAVAALLLALIVTSVGTSFVANNNPSQVYTPPAQAVINGVVPEGSAVHQVAETMQGVGASLAGVGGVLVGVAAILGATASSSSSGVVNHINSNASSAAKSAFGR